MQQYNFKTMKDAEEAGLIEVQVRDYRRAVDGERAVLKRRRKAARAARQRGRRS